MSVIKDAIAAMKEVVLLTEKVERAGETLSDMANELRDHDRRLIRLETIIDMASAQAPRRLDKD